MFTMCAYPGYAAWSRGSTTDNQYRTYGNIDEESAKSIPGFLKVVRQGSFVGVVARTEWAAMRAAYKP